MNVGILALQGDFEAHARALRSAGASSQEVRLPSDLDRCDGLIIPGGESTTMLHLIGETALWQPLADFAATHPVFGTCAGAILIAREVIHPSQPSFGLLDITIERNAYGRQAQSHVGRIEALGQTVEAVFIRAPIIRRAGPDVEVLATYAGTPVLARNSRHLVATFHPELTSTPLIHSYFLEHFLAQTAACPA